MKATCISTLALFFGMLMPAGAETIPGALKHCIDKSATNLVVIAHQKADNLLDYWIVGFRAGEGGGQALVTLKNQRCELVGSDNVVWPLAQWKIGRQLARTLALDALQRELDTNHEGIASLQKRIDGLPSYQLDYLAPEQKWALRQRGIRLPNQAGNP